MQLGKLKYLCAMLTDTLLADFNKVATPEAPLIFLALNGCILKKGDKGDRRCSFCSSANTVPTVCI